jgi:hypothetical protein
VEGREQKIYHKIDEEVLRFRWRSPQPLRMFGLSGNLERAKSWPGGLETNFPLKAIAPLPKEEVRFRLLRSDDVPATNPPS